MTDNYRGPAPQLGCRPSYLLPLTSHLIPSVRPPRLPVPLVVLALLLAAELELPVDVEGPPGGELAVLAVQVIVEVAVRGVVGAGVSVAAVAPVVAIAPVVAVAVVVVPV